MAGLILALLAELLADEGGGGLGEDGANDKGGNAVQPQPPQQQGNHRRGQRDLGGAQAEDQVAQGIDLGQGKAQADGEQQKDDTEFGNKLDVIFFQHGAGGMGAEQHPHQQVAEAGRNAQVLEQQHHKDGEPEQQQQLYQGMFKHGGVVSGSGGPP